MKENMEQLEKKLISERENILRDQKKILDQQLKVGVPLLSNSQCHLCFVRMVKVRARSWKKAPQQFGAGDSLKLASCDLLFFRWLL